LNSKALIIGNGFLGKHIIYEFKNHGIQAIGTHFHGNDSYTKMDVRDPSSIDKAISNFKPDLIINCAANTQLDFLETNPDIAFSINAEGAKNVALSSQKNMTRLVHISTDGVFDGIRGMYTENDSLNPINNYAKSKVLGEKLVMENSDNFVIVRTNFYGFDEGNRFLFNWVLNALKQKKQLVGFTDVIFTPLQVSNLSSMILELSTTDYQGIIHLASDEVMSKYQFAVNVAQIFDFDKGLITKGSIDEHVDFVARRPKNTSLSNKKAKELLKTPIVPMTQWLYQIKNHLGEGLRDNSSLR